MALPPLFDVSDLPFGVPPIVGGVGTPPASGRQAAAPGRPPVQLSRFDQVRWAVRGGDSPSTVQGRTPSADQIVDIAAGNYVLWEPSDRPVSGLATGPGISTGEALTHLATLLSWTWAPLFSLAIATNALASVRVWDIVHRAMPGLQVYIDDADAVFDFLGTMRYIGGPGRLPSILE